MCTQYQAIPLLTVLAGLAAGVLCALIFGVMLYAARAFAFEHSLLLALPFALLAAIGAYFGVMNAAVRHAVLPHTSPLTRAEPGTHTALARQIVRCPASVHASPACVHETSQLHHNQEACCAHA